MFFRVLFGVFLKFLEVVGCFVSSLLSLFDFLGVFNVFVSFAKSEKDYV